MRRIFRFVLMLCLATILACVVVGSLLLQDTPVLGPSAAPSAQDVADARQLLHGIRTASDNARVAPPILKTDTHQLNSALRLGARIIPGLRGEIDLSGKALIGAVSVPVPWISGQKWLNLTGRMPEFEGKLEVSEVTIGGRNMPPALMLWLFRTVANFGLGNRIGDTVLNAATQMSVHGEELTFRLSLDEMGKNGIMRGTFGALRGAEMPTSDEIEAYHLRIRAAMADGTLASTGSFMPYLRFTLSLAHVGDPSKPLPQRYTAAMLGLAKACGPGEFALIVGRLVFDKNEQVKTWPTSCDGVTLNGRTDTRRHFLISAALQSISNTGFAFSVGEFKELYDTISGAGGYDFTDIAANLSGIRLSNVLMAMQGEEWEGFLPRMAQDGDVIVSFDGIPSMMPQDAFVERFGDVDSPAYLEVLADIERRIDRLPLYR